MISRILIVGCDLVGVVTLRRLLEVGGGSEVDTASSIAEARAKTLVHTPDLVLIDAAFELETGYQTVRMLREALGGAPVPVIYVAGPMLQHGNRISSSDRGASQHWMEP